MMKESGNLNHTNLNKILQSGSIKSSQASSRRETPTRNFLCFNLGKEFYGIEAHQVKEIIPNQLPTPIPCTPDYILGAIYFRGQILPILNLKLILGLPNDPFPEKSRILITESNGITAGIKSDNVSEIISIPEEKIQPPLSVLEKIQADYLVGQVYRENHFIILLNLNKILEASRIQRRESTWQ